MIKIYIYISRKELFAWSSRKAKLRVRVGVEAGDPFLLRVP